VTWSPDPDAFLGDLEAKPGALRSLAPRLEADPWREVESTGRTVFVGMGSSRFAALPVAAMLRANGRDVVVERASAVAVAPAALGTLAVAISASGTTPETLAAQRKLPSITTSRIAFAGAYHGWGFHEDGALSGVVAARHLGVEWATVADRDAVVAVAVAS